MKAGRRMRANAATALDPTPPQRGGTVEEVDQRVTLARQYLAEVSGTSVEQLPPSVLMRECAELRRQLGQVLGAIGEAAGDARDALGTEKAGELPPEINPADAHQADAFWRGYLRAQLAKVARETGGPR